VIVFALSIGLTEAEIEDALHGKQSEDRYNRLIVTWMQAMDDKGERVPGIPSYYVDGKYESVLTLDEFGTLAKGEALDRAPSGMTPLAKDGKPANFTPIT
jgi:hypothetical protein